MVPRELQGVTTMRCERHSSRRKQGVANTKGGDERARLLQPVVEVGS